MPSCWRVALVRITVASKFPSIDNIMQHYTYFAKQNIFKNNKAPTAKLKTFTEFTQTVLKTQNHLKPILSKIISKHVKEGYFAKLFSQNYFRKTISAKLFSQNYFREIRLF